LIAEMAISEGLDAEIAAVMRTKRSLRNSNLL
jgi:hypothetical protein